MAYTPSITELLLQKQLNPQSPFTPGINPAGPNPQQTPGLGKIGGAFKGLDGFLGKPGGMMLMNLLAQQGYSKMPQSRLGAVGRAALMTSQQQAGQSQAEAQRKLMEAQGKYYTAKAGAEGQVGGGEPLTTIAKLRADHLAGRVSAEVFEAERDKILRATSDNQFDQTKIMRGEFRSDTDGIRTSQGALANAKSLVNQGNPIAATAAFTSFIRSIDNSVVRPAEQAAYSSAGGLARRIEDELSKLSGKGPLGENTRRDLLTAIETLEEQMNGIHKRTVDYYSKEAVKWKLDPESITGLPSQSAASPPPTPFSGPWNPDYEGTPEEKRSTLQRELDAVNQELKMLDEQLGKD